MPYGKPFTEEERKLRHLSKHGTLENFPEERRGEGTFWRERFEKEIHDALVKIHEAIECLKEVKNKLEKVL